MTIEALGNTFCTGRPQKLNEMSIAELCGVVVEAERAFAEPNGCCGAPCPYGSGHRYCGRRKGHSATDPDHHFTRADIYEYAAPKLAKMLRDFASSNSK